MDKGKIIAELTKDKELMEVCRKITSNSPIWEDLYQEVLIILLQKPNELIQEIYQSGKLRAFAIKTMLNQWTNEYSAFAKQNEHLINKVVYTQNTTQLPVFSDPSITSNIKHWEAIIKEQNYNITSINPQTIKIVSVMEQMRVEDNNSGSGCPYRTIIFNNFLKCGSIRETADAMNINFMSIQRTVLEIKQKIREKK